MQEYEVVYNQIFLLQILPCTKFDYEEISSPISFLLHDLSLQSQ